MNFHVGTLRMPNKLLAKYSLLEHLMNAVLILHFYWSKSKIFRGGGGKAGVADGAGSFLKNA